MMAKDALPELFLLSLCMAILRIDDLYDFSFHFCLPFIPIVNCPTCARTNNALWLVNTHHATNSIQSEKSSVPRFGDFVHFGQPFKAGGNNNFTQITHIVRGIFVKVSKSFIFLVNSCLGNFYRHLTIFIWSHWRRVSALLRNLFYGIGSCSFLPLANRKIQRDSNLHCQSR